ncbi:hypothetical protein [Streptomyces zingiberis]|uniref:Uncharacterized protein n=1 Tax=Streptomyces zingiberis TaxID=2053010 RepID=A0ABX1BWG1_9ACTN|nr:hypothetical protein [Streptomyces zingiberis]NJP99633.1 hypothetical protein [Streptomyces zingiberis]
MSPRRRSGGSSAASAIRLVADVAAGILVLWIVMYLLDANRANDLVSFVREAALWLSGWAQGLFTVDLDWLQVVLTFGLPALVYLIIGHALAARLPGRA